MNEELDPLEAELAALQPRSPSPRLEGAIENALPGGAVQNALRGVRRQRIRRTIAAISIAAGAIAASLLALAWFGGSSSEPVVETIPPGPWPTPPATTAFDPTLPSVWSFRQAAAHSDDELNVLLDQHAGHSPSERSDYVQIRGFGGFENMRHDFKGEL